MGYAWDVYNRHGGRHIIEVQSQWYILSYAFKWLGEKNITTRCLPDYPSWKKDREDDASLVRELHGLFDEADVIVAHNGTRFDERKSNARFIAHGLSPPSPFQSIDTLKIARKHFAFDSNKLDDLGKYLGVGRKLPNTGKALWLGCMAGDKRAWEDMRKYNAQDVALLERVYLKLRPWSISHPNLNNYTRKDGCPVCQSDKTRAFGWRYLKSGRRQRYVCRPCGHRFDAGPLVRE